MGGKEVVGSRAFNVEYLPNRFDEELRDEIISYLGEYRFQLQKYDYHLVYEVGTDGWHLCDPHRKEAMLVKARRSIQERKKRDHPTHREEAEEIGIATLDELLTTATIGDTILWASPPGPREEGYGDYGFIYMGEIVSSSPQSKHVKMAAFRVEHPTLKQYNKFFTFLIGRSYTFLHADQFLASPMIVDRGIRQQFVERVIGNMFSTAKEPKQDELFKRAIRKLDPLINEFILMRGFASKEEKLKAFYAIENYGLVLKNRCDQTDQEEIIYFDERWSIPLHLLKETYGYEPPQVLGSCGATNSDSIQSNNILSHGYEKLMKALFGETEWFTCPNCGYQADGPVGNSCPSCSITKEDYAKESGEKICG